MRKIEELIECGVHSMPKNYLYNVKPGDLFLTPSCNIIEIRSETGDGYRVLVRATGKEINVNFKYIQNRATRCILLEKTD